MLKIFISHSSGDAYLAEQIIYLLRESLNLRAVDIRCTSVDGYRLPGGADTDEQLRKEISDSLVFIGLLSPSSLASTYVIFELGARWGVKKHLIPLLAPGLNPSSLKGPVAALNALSCSNSSQIHQLLFEVSNELNIQLEPASSYQKWIEKITKLEVPSMSPEISTIPNVSAEIRSSEILNTSPEEIERMVKEIAASEHPNDFSTQKYAVNEQMKAWEALRSYSDPAIPGEIITSVLLKAAEEHPNDFSTQLYVVRDQLTSWKKLQ